MALPVTVACTSMCPAIRRLFSSGLARLAPCDAIHRATIARSASSPSLPLRGATPRRCATFAVRHLTVRNLDTATPRRCATSRCATLPARNLLSSYRHLECHSTVHTSCDCTATSRATPRATPRGALLTARHLDGATPLATPRATPVPVFRHGGCVDLGQNLVHCDIWPVHVPARAPPGARRRAGRAPSCAQRCAALARASVPPCLVAAPSSPWSPCRFSDIGHASRGSVLRTGRGSSERYYVRTQRTFGVLNSGRYKFGQWFSPLTKVGAQLSVAAVPTKASSSSVLTAARVHPACAAAMRPTNALPSASVFAGRTAADGLALAFSWTSSVRAA